MDAAMVAQVRSFNRLVTERVGALDDRYLNRDRSLGQARLLWEIGSEGRDVRSLRTELGLDSGYLSRMLRSLETAGLVSMEPDEADRRLRRVRLTPTGRAERAVLDRRSDALAMSLLEPLDPARRARLVEAMADVERLLTAASVVFTATDPASPLVQHCLRAYFAELARRFEAGFDPSRSVHEREFAPPSGMFLVATLRSSPIGCGAVRFRPRGVADLKRMWIAERARGLGLGRRLLAELEGHAAARGARRVRLETNRVLTEAIELYRSAGYVEVAPFNDEPYAHLWFEKRLRARRGAA